MEILEWRWVLCEKWTKMGISRNLYVRDRFIEV